MTKDDMLWLAGLLEGEGCFAYQLSPEIALGMTDRDIVARVARLFGRNVTGPYKYAGYRKPCYYTRVFSGPAVDIMRRLLPYMGKRRSSKIRSILARHRRAPGRGHRLGSGAKPRCHPRRRHYAFSLCRSCYRKSRWDRGLSR